VPAVLVARIEPWIGAVVAGLLIHVVVHDARRGRRASRPPR